MRVLLAALIAIFASVVSAHAQTPVQTYAGTITNAALPQPALVEMSVDVTPTGAADQLDARVLNGECHLNTSYHVEKSDCLSAYLYNNGADMTYGYGGTLQAWNQSTGNADWMTGAMFASRTLDSAYSDVARGSRSVADNRRTGSVLAMRYAIGAQDGVLNYGHVGTVYGGEAFYQGFAGSTADYVYGQHVSVDNSGALPQVYGLRIDTYNQTGASITNWRGIYIAQPTGPAPTGTNAPIYSAATGTSYFAGDIKVGSATQGLQAEISALEARVAALEAAQ